MEFNEASTEEFRTLTLADYSQKAMGRDIKKELQSGSGRQVDTLLRIPKTVPFMFGIGGGLHVLESKNGKEAKWLTLDWKGGPPSDYETGTVYFEDEKARTFKKFSENADGGWMWESSKKKEEKLSYKVGDPDWEFKIYLDASRRNSARINNDLNMQGWAVASVTDTEHFDLPDGLAYLSLEPYYEQGAQMESFVVFDKERADFDYINYDGWSEEYDAQKRAEGWVFIENPEESRAVYMKTLR